MTIPFPRSIAYTHALAFATLFALGLMAEGNPPLMCCTLACIILVGTLAFNVGGGMRSTTGAYVFFTVLFTGLLGAMTKFVLNEPLLENVANADQTLAIYFAGTVTMTLAVFASKRLRRKTPILKDRLTYENTPRVVMGCFAAGVMLPTVLQLLFPGGAGAFGTILAQLNIALPLCVSVGVYQRVRQTNGRVSFNWPSFLAFLYSTYIGLAAFSKEGIFGSATAWLVAAAAARIRFGALKAMVVLAVGIGSVYLLVPYSQYGRNFRLGYGGNFELSKQLLRHPLETRKLAYARADVRPMEQYHWYNADHGILDRLTLVPIDSALIRQTDAAGPIGWTNAGLYFLNILPHFILPNKADLATGNQYAHEIGMLAAADHTTGISFSPFGEAYHLGSWNGILVLLPLVECFMFVVLESVVGSLDDSPWGLFFIAYFSHGAAEGMLQVPVRMASGGVEAILACALFMIYVTPILATFIIGPEKRLTRRILPVRAVVRRQA